MGASKVFYGIRVHPPQVVESLKVYDAYSEKAKVFRSLFSQAERDAEIEKDEKNKEKKEGKRVTLPAELIEMICKKLLSAMLFHRGLTDYHEDEAKDQNSDSESDDDFDFYESNRWDIRFIHGGNSGYESKQLLAKHFGRLTLETCTAAGYPVWYLILKRHSANLSECWPSGDYVGAEDRVKVIPSNYFTIKQKDHAQFRKIMKCLRLHQLDAQDYEIDDEEGEDEDESGSESENNKFVPKRIAKGGAAKPVWMSYTYAAAPGYGY